MVKKNDESFKQQDEVIRLSYEMREVHRRLNELKKENDELKALLSLTGKSRHEYEAKVPFLFPLSANKLFFQFRSKI